MPSFDSRVRPELLSLPVEVRQQIWGYVVSGRTIHVRYAGAERFRDGGGPWDPTYVVHDTNCQASCSSVEQDPEEALVNPRPYSVHDAYSLHEACYSYYTFDSVQKMLGLHNRSRDPSRCPTKRTLLDPLLVCKQIYQEARAMFWASNTWSFCTSVGFRSFLYSRPIAERAMIKKIHITIDTGRRIDQWHSDLDLRKTLADFVSLEILHLDIQGALSNNGYNWTYPSEFYHGQSMLHLPRSGRYSIDLTDLPYLPVKDVKVTCRDTIGRNGSAMSVEERHKLGQAIRAKILEGPFTC